MSTLNNNSRSHASPQKVYDENKTKKNDAHIKDLLMKEGVHTGVTQNYS